MTTAKTISVTNKGDNSFTIYQGLTYIAGITPAWLRYSAPQLFHDTAELHRLITNAFAASYRDVDAARISTERQNALNSLALENFRQSARRKAYGTPAQVTQPLYATA